MTLKIIFLFDSKLDKIIHYNSGFVTLFGKDFHSINELRELIKDGIHSLVNTTMGRTFFTYQEQQYIFDVDKMDDGIIIFSGNQKPNEHASFSGLVDAHKLLRMLADNLPDMLWAKDVNGKYIFANKAICENLLMAENTDEPIGQGDVFFALREREKYKDNKDWHTFGELCFNSDEVVLANMKNMVFEEYGNVKGQLLCLEVHKAPFFDDSGRLLGTVGSGKDVTKEVKAQRELQLKEELMYQHAKMAVMGEMLENIIHQWKQSLSLISVMSSTAQMHNEIGLPIDNQEYFSNITKHILHLAETIDDFRDFFKHDKTQMLFKLNEVYKRTIDLLSAKIRKSGIVLIENCEEIEMIGYPREIIQVLMNIYSNAFDEFEMMDPLVDKLIFTTIMQDEDNAIVTIKDNAGGIPENIMDRIFESKFTTKSERNGTGIGLYMSKEMIGKHMNGSIKVKNEEYEYEGRIYKGALFTITLPIQKSVAQ